MVSPSSVRTTLCSTSFLHGQFVFAISPFEFLMTVESGSGRASKMACFHSSRCSFQYLYDPFATAVAANTGLRSSSLNSSRADLPSSLRRFLSFDVGGSFRSTSPTCRRYSFCFSPKSPRSESGRKRRIPSTLFFRSSVPRPLRTTLIPILLALMLSAPRPLSSRKVRALVSITSERTFRPCFLSKSRSLISVSLMSPRT